MNTMRQQYKQLSDDERAKDIFEQLDDLIAADPTRCPVCAAPQCFRCRCPE